ncbi:MAG: DUF5060 domain-containing protein [Firmicutes bacterium]|nr:DUF5060 domain-containing protein [Bacillota bacterium]
MDYQYEMKELTFKGPEPSGSHVETDLEAVFTLGEEKTTVKGFYAGDGQYRIRFLPLKEGNYTYKVSGIVSDSGSLSVQPARAGQHGPVWAEETHLRFADGTWFHSFGTTVYALAHQSGELTEETFSSLREAPFNKVRMCLFPKHYNYNHNDPDFFPFNILPGRKYEFRDAPAFVDPSDEIPVWDVHHPDFRFWDSFEKKLVRLDKMGIQVDLILFHPYDRWGFAKLSPEDNLVYLDYLVRRFAAYPNIWWSLANEYDLCRAKDLSDWPKFEDKIAETDPYHHLMSNHNCFPLYDFSHEKITHCSCQLRTMTMVPELQRKYGKPVLYDECVYEGNLPETWGSISAAEMVNRFWKVTATGGYCTHGEVFLDPAQEELDEAVLWWAKGGKLKGKSPRRIAFLRSIMEEIGDPLSPVVGGIWNLLTMSETELAQALEKLPSGMKGLVRVMLSMDKVELTRHVDAEAEFVGATDDRRVFLFYYGTDCHARVTIDLPEDRVYKVEVLDAWNMTRMLANNAASGKTVIRLPGHEYMAVLATAKK